MTFPPSDAPDWTGIPGGARYLGTLDMSGTYVSKNANLAFAPASYDGAVYVISTGDAHSSTLSARVVVANNDQSISLTDQDMYGQGEFMTEPVVAFVSAALGTNWEVDAHADGGVASDWHLWVFAVPSYPGSRIVHDQRPLLVRQNGVPYRQLYSDKAFHTPGVTTRATITFAADPNGVLGWVVDEASWTHIGHGAAGSVIARILDGATVIWQQRLQVGATDGDRDRYVMGPLAGYSSAPGNSLTVDFSAAPAAGNVEAVAAGAYQYALL